MNDSSMQEDWVDQQFNVSDDSSEADEEAAYKQFESHLIPVKNAQTFSRVAKFYWFWFVLLLIHYLVFLRIPQTQGECRNSPPQVNQLTGAIIEYGSADYKCNTFKSNAFIIIFYIFCCMYFSLQSY